MKGSKEGCDDDDDDDDDDDAIRNSRQGNQNLREGEYRCSKVSNDLTVWPLPLLQRKQLTPRENKGRKREGK